MALKKKSKEIDGITYHVETMDGIRALKTQARLVKILGSGITGLKTVDIQKIFNKKGVDVKTIVKLLEPLLDNFDDTEVVDFILSLFEKGVTYEAKTEEGETIEHKVIFEAHFNGKINTAWKVTAFILMTNFSLGK